MISMPSQVEYGLRTLVPFDVAYLVVSESQQTSDKIFLPFDDGGSFTSVIENTFVDD